MLRQKGWKEIINFSHKKNPLVIGGFFKYPDFGVLRLIFSFHSKDSRAMAEVFIVGKYQKEICLIEIYDITNLNRQFYRLSDRKNLPLAVGRYRRVHFVTVCVQNWKTLDNYVGRNWDYHYSTSTKLKLSP